MLILSVNQSHSGQQDGSHVPRYLGLNWVLKWADGIAGARSLKACIHPYLVLAGSPERLGLVPGDSSVAWLLVAWQQPRTVRLCHESLGLWA